MTVECNIEVVTRVVIFDFGINHFLKILAIFFFYFFFNELDYSLAKARMMGVSYITGRKENKKLWKVKQEKFELTGTVI